MTWNTDVLLASLEQRSGATASGVYCSAFNLTVAKDGTEGEPEAREGLVGKTKCTWQFEAEDQTVAPGVKFVSADYAAFLFQWMEWLDKDDLGSNAVFLATAASGNYELGDYATSGGVLLNPMNKASTVTGWPSSAIIFDGGVFADPESLLVAEIGDASYYPNADGPFKSTQIVTTSTRALVNQYAGLQGIYDTFNNDKASYDTLKNAYNEANESEKLRDADAGKWLFEPKTEIPERPCKPSQPPAWWGVKLALSEGIQSSAPAFSKFEETMQAYLAGTAAKKN